MKVTISPSEDQAAEKFPYYTVSIELPIDDSCTVEQAVEMTFMALAAWGFDKEIITKTFHEFIP